LFIMRIFAARATAELLRIRAEQRLSESEARYRDLYENAPNPYWIVGTDGRVVSANRPFAELTGYDVEELVGVPTHTLAPDTPAGKPRVREVRAKRLAGEAVSGWELELLRKDGGPLWIKLWMQPVRGVDSSLQAARCFCVDVTAQVLAQREQARLQ